MIEEIILNYLRENGFPCFMSVPENPSGTDIKQGKPFSRR